MARDVEIEPRALPVFRVGLDVRLDRLAERVEGLEDLLPHRAGVLAQRSLGHRPIVDHDGCDVPAGHELVTVRGRRQAAAARVEQPSGELLGVTLRQPEIADGRIAIDADDHGKMQRVLRHRATSRT